MATPQKWLTMTEAELQAELDRMVEQMARYERQARHQRFWIERLRTFMAERFLDRAPQPSDWLRQARSRLPPRE